MAPTYMSRVTRTVAWPAMQETSAGSRCQPDRAVVQNTCRRLCQVQAPSPCGVAPPGGLVGGRQDAAVEVGGPPPGAAGGGEHQPERVGSGVLLGPGLPGAGGEPVRERVAGRGAGGVDGAAPLAALGRLQVQRPGDLDDLAVHGDDPGGRGDLGGGQGEQLALPQPGVGRGGWPSAQPGPRAARRPGPGRAGPHHDRRGSRRGRRTGPIPRRWPPAGRARPARRPASAPP